MVRLRRRRWAECVAAAVLTCCAGRSNVAHDEPRPVPLVAMAVPEIVDPGENLPAKRRAPITIGTCSARSASGIERFTIAHLNDLQARYSDRIAGRSRYGYIAGYLEGLKRDVESTIVLDAGDDYEKGALAELRSMGEATRQMVQALPIDVRTIGNHDFAYGTASVLRDVLESAHPVLASNVHRVDPEAPDPFESFVRVDIGCVKVGIVGLVASSYGSNDYPSRDPFDETFEQDDQYERVVADLVLAHRSEVDVFIALNHVGYWVDVDLARRVPGLDLVVGGHSEDLLPQPVLVRRTDGSHAYVVQAGHWGQTLGRADVAVDLVGRTLSIERYAIVNVDATLPYDEEVGDLARSLEDEAAPDAHSAIAIVGAPIAQGKPMADLVFRAAQERWGVDALLLGKDVFWEGLPQGPLTAQKLYDTVLVQREPAGTSGFSSIFIASVSGATLLGLRAHLIVGPMYAYYAPDTIDPGRIYRFAVEKRALENPQMALYAGAPAFAPSRYAGELIDLLEAYAKDRTRRELTLP
jgi:5'-nucleotidase / UDP-sugar diphosphatase